jgi:NOL1/NOP2/sun family putative RNA methylase
MSDREFFTHRYKRLGWEYKKNEIKQAIRINTNVKNASDAVKRLQESGVELEKVPFLEHGYWINASGFSVGATPEYLLGLYSIQEAAAQIPATLFTGLCGKTVLDACAAPGGKTTQLADLMHNTGAIVALDIDAQKLIALSNHLERCHTKNTIVHRMDARQVSQLKTRFNRIILDVPCSGNFATDKEWFRRRTIKDIERNAALQRNILEEAVKTLSDDGEIIYSTCSLEPEEDELNIDWATRNLNLSVEEVNCYGQEGLTEVFGKQLNHKIVNCRRIWPGPTQGFFVCRLKRGESL